MSKTVLTTIVLLSIAIQIISCDFISNEIYINITNAIPCVRRLNATHEIGCGNLDQSSYDGILYVVNSSLDISNLNNINLIDAKKLILIALNSNIFKQIVDYYISKKDTKQLINGIVLISLDDDSTFYSYSDDNQKPNEQFSFYNDRPTYNAINWNSAGTSYMFNKFKVPVYLITNQTESNLILDCYNRYNKDIFSSNTTQATINIKTTDKLCGMQLGLQMFAASNSRVCIRRNNIKHSLSDNTFCDPLGSYNIYNYLSLKPYKSSTPTMNYILLSTQIDAFTMFEYYTPGVSKPITSIISLLAIADLLSNYRNDIADNFDLIFMFFNNEAFDYAGSSRFVYDLNTKNFPNLLYKNDQVKMEANVLKVLIELGELMNIGLDSSNKLYIHSDPITYASNQNYRQVIDNLVSSLKTLSNDTIITTNSQPTQNDTLPPSSLHSFLKGNLQIPGIVISDHDYEYKNKYYHSIYDTKSTNLNNLNWSLSTTSELDAINSSPLISLQIQKYTTYVAQLLYSRLTNNTKQLNSTITTNLKLINNLLYCYVYNTTCLLFRSILTGQLYSSYDRLLQAYNPEYKLSFYASVNNDTTSGIYITIMMLRYLMREKLLDTANETECKLDSASVINTASLTQRQYYNAIYLSNSTNYLNANSISLCIVSAVYLNSSMSPAFIDYINTNGDVTMTSNYSAWVESQWESKQTHMRIFIFPTKSIEIVTISIGLVVCITSAIVTFLINKYLTNWLLSSDEIEVLNENS